MTIGSGGFPSDPSSRKAVLVLTQHDVERCGYTDGAAEGLLDDEAFVPRVPIRPQDGDLVSLTNIVDANLARPGSLLIQNPFDADSYEDASVAMQRFALAKHMHFSEFCMYLGAHEVRVEEIELRTRTGKSTMTFEVNGPRLLGGGNVASSHEDLESLSAQMCLQYEFDGGEPDSAAAERMLRRRGLWNDQTMRNMLEMRRSSKNPVKRFKLALNLSSEFKNNLNVVGRLRIPKFVKMTTEYDKIVSESRTYTLTVSVLF